MYVKLWISLSCVNLIIYSLTNFLKVEVELYINKSISLKFQVEIENIYVH